MSLILISDGFLTTSKTTSAAGSNETDFLTGNGIPFASSSVTNVLVITPTVRVLDGVHSHPTDNREVVSLGLQMSQKNLSRPNPRKRTRKEEKEEEKNLVFVPSTTSFEHGLVGTTTASNNSNCTTGSGEEGLFHTRRHADTSFASISVVRDNGAIVTGSTGNFASVSGLFFNVADDATYKTHNHNQKQTTTNMPSFKE